jgi:hypothetical protein
LVYATVGVGDTGTASLAYNPDYPEASPQLGIDYDSDGAVDEYMEPTGALGPVEGYDHNPPLSTIELEGVTDTTGWYTGLVQVTLTATDAESGVAFIEYTLDGGTTVQSYTGPFQTVAEETPVLYVQAVDRAGNRETPVGIAVLRPPHRIYLPTILYTE